MNLTADARRRQIDEKLRIERRAAEALRRRREHADGADRAALDRALEASARYVAKLEKLLGGRGAGK